MEFLQSFMDSVLTEPVALALFRAPFWIWLLVASSLGALTLWTYWRCYVEEAREEAAIAAPGPGFAAGAAPASAPALDPAEQEGDAQSGLRYRNWALETRMRRILDAARSGEPLEVEALAEGLEDILDGAPVAGDDGAPPSDVSALKYANWRAQMRIAELEEAVAGRETEPAAAAAPTAPEPVAFAAADPGLADRAERLEGRVRRLLTAAKLGELSIFSAVEEEMEAEAAGEAAPDPSAALLTRIADLESRNAALEDAASGLRYRRWLLARRLGDSLEAARDGDVDIDAVLADLAKDGEAPRYGAPGANGFMSARALPTAAASAALEAPAADLEAHEALRRRAAAMEQEVRRLRAAAPALSEETPLRAAASLRYRLWLAQAELRRERDREAPRLASVSAPQEARADARAAAAAPSTTGRDADEERRLRGLLARAENGLRALRAEQSAAAAAATRDAAQRFDALQQALTAERAARLEAERGREAAATAAAESGAEAQAAAEAGLAAARARVASLRSELWIAQRALADRAAENARLAEMETEIARLRASARLEPQLTAELETLRARLRQYDDAARSAPSPEAMRQREAEAEALRSRLALAQAEADRLKAELNAASRERRLAAAGASLASMRSGASQEPALRADPFALRAGRRAAIEPALEDEETHLAARASLADVVGSPRRGVEDAARELIESGRVVAVDSNRPVGLRAAPDQGTPDDLTLIGGVSAKLAARMNRAGVYYFSQIAEFGAYELAWLDDKLGLGGEVVSGRWLPQAERLAAWRREGRLALGGKGPRRPLGAGEEASPADEARRPTAAEAETVRSLPSHPRSIAITAPLSGAEAAALELIERGLGPAAAAEPPASFSREPFKPDDALDDLKAIQGVGPGLESALRALGVGRYRQLAAMTPADAAWLDKRLGLGGRVVRDRWLPQAKALADRAEAERRAAAQAEEQESGAAPIADRSALASAARTPEPAPDRPGRATAAAAASLSSRASAPAPEMAAPMAGEIAPPRDPALSRSSDAVEAEAAALIERGGASGALIDRPASARPGPDDEGDDLKAIKGVGPKQEAQLKALGFHSFAQIAAFEPEDLAWLDAAMGLRGRAVGEGWIRQARRLAERKAAGELRLGPENTWTLPDPTSDRSAALEAARRSALLAVEREAMRLIDGGVRSDGLPRPEGLLPGPKDASPDPLNEIEGVNAHLEQLLNDVGVYYYRQLARFSASDIAWLDARLSFNGRVVRDRWVAQAAALERLQRGGAAEG